jgi:hypothetical protein
MEEEQQLFRVVLVSQVVSAAEGAHQQRQARGRAKIMECGAVSAGGSTVERSRNR